MTTQADVLLVGSVPFESATKVFHTCDRVIGDRVPPLTDGVAGAREYTPIACRSLPSFGIAADVSRIPDSHREVAGELRGR